MKSRILLPALFALFAQTPTFGQILIQPPQSEVTLQALEDTWILKNSPSTHGNSPLLTLEGDPILPNATEVYVKFHVPQGITVSCAHLSVFKQNLSSNNMLEVASVVVPGGPGNVDGLHWYNRPTNANVLGTSLITSSQGRQQYAVKPAVVPGADVVFRLRLMNPGFGDLRSLEYPGSFDPELIVHYVPQQAAEDTWVQGNAPTATHCAAPDPEYTTLGLRGAPGVSDEKEVFLRYDVPSWATVSSARLRFYKYNFNAGNTLEIATVAHAGGLCFDWNARPTNATVVDTPSISAVTGFDSFDVTSAITPGTSVVFRLRLLNSGWGNLRSRENSQSFGTPSLIINPSVCPLGLIYCGPAVVNSSGESANVAATGNNDSSSGAYAIQLEATNLPTNQFGYFLASQTQAFIPTPGGSQGNLCLGGQIARFSGQVLNSGLLGEFALDVDPSNIPTSPTSAILPGQTWNFQAWFRDQNPGNTSNFTDAVSIDFE